MFIEPEHHRVLIGGVVRDKQVTAVPDEHPGRVKEAMALEDFLDRPVEPRLPLCGGHVAHVLAQHIPIAGRLAVIRILVIEAHAAPDHRLALGIQMLGSQRRIQGAQQAAAAHHPLPGVEGVLAAPQRVPHAPRMRFNQFQVHRVLWAARVAVGGWPVRRSAPRGRPPL